ncbi:cytochrome b [Legionella sp. km772]|uniref:cytochrome b n=1 Tax=Legionella sp. km772 TaxID=2498111 RepID=UPI000F8D0221|nr:cytochrome b [Legionella sp. km772]RUR11128.1 cytochrome b [Legionella sp. km772]
MTDLPIGIQKLKLYGLHKAFGILVLILAILRIIWRLSNKTPSLNIPKLELIAARLAHLALYILMLAMPISGWLMSSAAGLAPSFFGLFTLPNLVAPNDELREWFAFVHEWLAYGLIAIISVHTLAALKHHFIDKDDILRRMIS